VSDNTFSQPKLFNYKASTMHGYQLLFGRSTVGKIRTVYKLLKALSELALALVSELTWAVVSESA
jgi:hypothetical protein